MYPSPKASTELMNIFIIYPVSRCFYLLVMNEYHIDGVMFSIARLECGFSDLS
jgi:hypothetical protein